MPTDDYARALQLIGLASEHALQGNHDTARTVLRSAFTDGLLDRNDRRVGLLHYQAVLALIDARENKVVPAAAGLTNTMRELRNVGARERPNIIARCAQAMLELPHNKQIQRLLAGAKKDWEGRSYVKAYQKIRDAKRLRVRHVTLTPPAVEAEITQASTLAMIHLMENNAPQVAIAITADLQKRGLIERS